MLTNQLFAPSGDVRLLLFSPRSQVIKPISKNVEVKAFRKKQGDTFGIFSSTPGLRFACDPGELSLLPSQCSQVSCQRNAGSSTCTFDANTV